jgi:TonB family protein
VSRKAFILALLISVLFIHLPLIYFITSHDFSQNRDPQFHKNETVVMLNLKPPATEIADIAQPKVEKVPQKASVHSKYNSSVSEETVAQKTTSQKNPSQQTPQTTPYTVPTLIKPQLSLQDELKQIQMEQKQIEKQKYANLYESPKAKNDWAAWQTPIQGEVSGGNDDFLPSYKIGSRTYLNALANPNIFYFVELKRKFRLAFNPEPALRFNFDKISKGQMSVIWGVSVDAQGKLKDLILIRSSGLSDYDQEARRTISASAPFTQPPAHLLEKDGLLNMAWTFVVHL